MADTSGRWSELPLDEVTPRFSFVPGTERNKFSVVWRELETYDLPQVQRIVRRAGWKASLKSLTRYTNYVGWTIRAALRSKNTIVALTAGRYLGIDSSNVIKCVWVHPDYIDTTVPVRLLQLARLELPEKPCVAYVSAADEPLRATMTALGWTDVTDVDDANSTRSHPRREFRIRAVADREYRAALAAGGSVRQQAEKRKPG